MKDCEEKENVTNESQGTEQQKLFVDLVAATARRLFNYMEISPEDSLLHRLYDAEVIDLTHDVSFLIAVPPAETACCVPGTREILLQRGDLLSLPIQVFEMVHLNTYQKDVINRYSRLSCILELDTAQAQYNHREAFSSLELSVAKDKLARLQDLQTQVNTVWKGARWLIDVITFARDRGSSQQSVSWSKFVWNKLGHYLNEIFLRTSFLNNFITQTSYTACWGDLLFLNCELSYIPKIRSQASCAIMYKIHKVDTSRWDKFLFLYEHVKLLSVMIN